jgi:DNA invertase Pin-like site-specific DNA recombinase
VQQDAQARTVPTEIRDSLRGEARQTLFQVGVRLAGGMSLNEVARELSVKRTEVERRLDALRAELTAAAQ